MGGESASSGPDSAAGPKVVWTTRPPGVERLHRDGYHVAFFPALRAELIQPARRVGLGRRSLANPAQALLDLFAARARVAVLDVSTATVEDLVDVYGYVVEPAHRRGCDLLIGADAELSDLEDGGYVDPGFDYPWTLERLLHLVGGSNSSPPVHYASDPSAHSGGDSSRAAPWIRGLDASQTSAVTVGGGVVQIIAPAGSGKTRVLVARVQELISRGVPAERILCGAFNKATRKELQKRLALPRVTVHSFHSLGRHVLECEDLLAEDIQEPSHGLLRKLAREAKQAVDGVWIDPQEAAEAISRYKLADMIEPAEAVRRARESRSIDRLTSATLYELYQRTLGDSERMDFDDLILEPIRLLRQDAQKRRAWQSRWTHVLVDEYQDIEPAQELLIKLLAAPEDCLFAVGDEDQCLYAWRRASVSRVVELDQTYPGLERHALETNYRCPGDVVRRSASIIENNEQRFPKTIRAARADENAISLSESETAAGAAGAVANLANARRWRRDDAVILARTTRVLRNVAVALAQAGVRFDGPEAIFKTVGALRTVEAYLRLLSAPRTARAEDVEEVFRVPNRYLPGSLARSVATALQAGKTFALALAGLDVEDWRRERLTQDAPLLDALKSETSAKSLIRRMRAEGGVDGYYAEHEQLTPTEQVDLETLDALEAWAGERTPAEAARILSRQTQLLTDHRDPDGLELATIHGAKGREWPVVVLFGCEDGQLPHHRSLEGASTDEELVEAVEDERRLAYVAFTRTTGRLHIAYAGEPSRFLGEAGLVESVPEEARPAAADGRAQPSRRDQTTRRADGGPRDPELSRASRELKRLINQLRSSSIDERRSAASSLGFHPSSAASRALVTALTDRDARVRQTAASSLGRVGTEEALPELRKLLERESQDFIRSSARIAIGQIKKRMMGG